MKRSTNDLGQLLKALSDPTRGKIIEALARRPLCVSAIAARVGVTPSAVSQHLRILRQANLVTADKRGYWVHYSVNRERARAASAAVSRWFERLAAQPQTTCADRSRCPDKRRIRRTRSSARR